MKIKLISIFALAIMMASCSNQELLDSDSLQSVSQQTSSIRSYEEALQIAQASIQMVDDQTQTRAASPRKISLSDSKVCLGGGITRSETDNDTLMYVFNFEDSQGFAIISANKNTEALIAITEKGHYDPTVRDPNDGFNLFMDLAKKYVENNRQMGDPGGGGLDPILEFKDSIVPFSGYVGPFVEVKWGQNYPEGMFCPNNHSGCAVTAMAQVMSYFEYPTGIPLTYSGADQSYQALNWSNIKVHSISNHSQYTLCNADEATHKAIGRLCRQLGELSNSCYGPDGTETVINDVKQTLNTLGYTTTNWTDYSSSVVTGSINNLKPVIINGYRLNNDNGNQTLIGHMWVVDGYYYTGYESFTWNRPYGGFEWELVEHVIHKDYYHHYNWGYSGDNNGYYTTGVFSMPSVWIADGTINPALSNRNYNINVQTLSVYR